MIVTGQAYYEYELKKLMSQAIDELTANLVTAYRIEGFDYSSYRHHVGKIEGLRAALELCDEAQSVVNGKDRG